MKLLNIHRRDICTRAIAAKFDPILKKLDQVEHDLGMRFYAEFIPAAEVRAIQKLPKRWHSHKNHIRVNINGAYFDFNVKKDIILPTTTNIYYCLGQVEGESAKLGLDYLDEKKKYKDDRKIAEASLAAMLEKITTLDQLKKVWPDGKKFYAHVKEENMPMIQVDKINEMLSLP